MLIALIIAAVVSQVCVPLPANTPCGPTFKDYPIMRSVAEFNSNLNAGVIDTTSVATNLIANQVCISPQIFSAVNTLRFQTSIQCGMAVQQAISSGCSVPSGSPSAGPLLCEAQCLIALSTLNNLASDKVICPGPKIINTTTFSSYCSYVSSNLATNGNRCYTASTDEASYAGFSTLGLASSQCATISNDPICIAFTAAQAALIASPSTNAPNSTNSTVPQSISNSTVPASSALSNSNSPVSSSMKIIIIIISVVVVLLLIAGLAYYFYRKRKLNAALDIEFNHYGGTLAPKKFVYKAREDSYISPISKRVSIFAGSELSLKRNREKDSVFIEDMPSGTVRVKVIHPYGATLKDELQLHLDSYIFMVRSFDDGWGLGINPVSGAQGAFPLICVMEEVETPRRLSHYSRVYEKSPFSSHS